jgi:ribonuclease-3
MIESLQQKLGYQFINPALLEVALTHRSIRGENNERLEFLGDAILNFVIAEALFQQFPYAPEGQLSRLRANLVNEEVLAELAKNFQLGEYLRLGAGELKSGGMRRKSILADALEAIIGAIYLDVDMQLCQKIVLQWFGSRLLQSNNDESLKDAKSRLQEYLQSHRQPLPQYTVTSITGEAHLQNFHVSCEVSGMDYHTEGTGASRREAEQIAAAAYLDLLAKQ